MYHGSCLCGAVAFDIDADVADPIACHCEQCRRESGHVFSAVAAPLDALRFACDAGLSWYRHTPVATRGFCARCGTSLFWRGDDAAAVMVAMGSLEDTGDLRLIGHYWVDFKGDYHEIADGLPQYRGEES